MVATVHGGEMIIPRDAMHEFAAIVANAITKRGGGGQRLVVVPVVDRNDLPRAIYKLLGENRLILPSAQPATPTGIR
jgi:hypothetical protein